MVLIQAVTKEAINTALIALQRNQNVVIGGEKQRANTNVNITNVGTSAKDYTKQIEGLEEKVGLLEKAEALLQSQSNANRERILILENALQSLGLSDVDFNENSRILTITTLNGDEYTTKINSEMFALEVSGTTFTLSTPSQSQSIELPYIVTNEKGAPNGVATLDSSGRVPYSQLPESAMELKGEWNAETNTPPLTDGVGTNGDFYICSTPGTVTFGTGNTVRFLQNDRVLYDGSTHKWVKLLAGQVQSVNGLSGDVVLDATNINYSQNTTLKTEIDKKADSSSLATVATSGSYNDLTNKPTIPSAQVQSNWTQTDSAQKDFIKNKIPIWITSGSADDNMSPIDSVTNGSLRPVTSNAVYDALAGKMGAVFANSYYGMASPSGETNVWIRTTSQGIIPYQSGGANAGHGYLGTSSWYFAYAYIQNIYGTLNGSSSSVRDSNNGTVTTFAYSKAGLTGNPSWLAAWNGYELRAIAPSQVTSGNSSKLGNVSVQTSSIGGTTTETGNHWSYVVKAKFTATSGYIVYSNGLKIEWGKVSFSSTRTKTGEIETLQTYTSMQVYITAISSTPNSSGTGYTVTANNKFKYIIYGPVSSDRFVGMTWLVVGY